MAITEEPSTSPGFEFMADARKSKDGSEPDADSKFASEKFAGRLLKTRDALETFALGSLAVSVEILDTVKSLIEALPEGASVSEKIRGMALTGLEGIICWTNERVRSASAES